MRAILDSIVFAELFPLTLLAAIFVGFWGAARFQRRKNRPWVPSGIESSVIGFFALLISFTMLNSNTQARKREALVHAESDNIGNISRISRLMPRPVQDSLNHYMCAYLQVKMDFVDKDMTKDEWKAATESVIAGLQAYIVHPTDSLHLNEKQKDQVMTRFNELSTLFYQMHYAYDERTPSLILFALFSGALLVGALVGFMSGFPEKKHFLVPLIYFCLVTLTLQAIRDLDDPFHGTIKPSYRINKELFESLKQEQKLIRTLP